MQTRMRWSSIALLIWLVSAGLACKKDKTPMSGQSPQLNQPVIAPKEVLAYIALKHPQKTVDALLTLVKNFADLPLERQNLLDLLAQRANLPRDLLNTINLDATSWVVLLDQNQVGERDPGIMAFPLRSRKDFETALAKVMKKTGTEGDLGLYQPTAGEKGPTAIRLLITDTFVITPSSKKVLDLSRSFLQQQLFVRIPTYDLEAHLMLENIIKTSGKNFDQQLRQALTQVNSRVARGNNAPGTTVASMTEQSVQHYLNLIKSIHEVLITANVTAEKITLALRGEAKPGGMLQKVIQRQRPGEPFGYKLLPASSWLVLSSLGNPEAAGEAQRFWIPALRTLASETKGLDIKKLEETVASAREGMGEDFTIALHQPGSGSGLSASAVLRVISPTKARDSLNVAVDLAADWFKANWNGSKDNRFKIEKKAFTHKDAKGAVYSVRTSSLPSAEQQTELARLFGPAISFGWAIAGNYALFTMGKDCEAQLQKMSEGAEGSKVERSLLDNSAFRKAQTASPGRVGLLYFSLVDFFHSMEGTGVAGMAQTAAALKEVRTTTAPSIDWGVNATRSLFDISLHLPAEHFKALKPLLEKAMQKGGPASLFTTP